MGIMVSVKHANFILGSNLKNVLSSNDTKNLVDVTSAISIGIYPSVVILWSIV